MPPRKTQKKAPDLCAEHFPNGLADQPKDATVVSCEHGAWDVPDTTPPADDEGSGE